MSLPLRLPYCSPARRLRAVLLFPCFRAPVTPPPSPVCSQEPDSEPEGGTPESYAEEEAWLYSSGHWGRVLSGGVGAIPQGWAWPGSPSVQLAPQPRHRPPPPPTAIPASSAATSPITVSWRSSQSIRPIVLGRRPSVAQGPRRAKERQPGTASTGGKEPELRVNIQNERRLRSVEEPAPYLPVPRTLAFRGVAGRGLCPGKRTGKLGKPASASPEKYQGSCRRVTLEFKGVEKPR
ncbi:uncharacterized protein LOC127223734 [Phodopus roborovskii]|uniref:1700056E22Rik protein n=1 Tax=Phodopus roborovskii TaxID=109678 RepID=A0AAU9ZC15_PHORO|nr:uncharacterized protein LOC127223734 [Phodopus roborovskii]CAH6789625.1 1700056E22Rik [Phodopus roborovskii]